jgi:hypothetical protein
MEDQERNMDTRLVDAALDNELDAAQESQLYERLAVDVALRDSLRSARAIRDAARAYGASMTPPAELGAALFSKLGIDVATAIPVAGTVTSSTANGFFSGNGRHLMTAAFILIGGLLVWMLWNGSRNNTPPAAAPTNSTITNETQHSNSNTANTKASNNTAASTQSSTGPSVPAADNSHAGSPASSRNDATHDATTAPPTSHEAPHSVVAPRPSLRASLAGITSRTRVTRGSASSGTRGPSTPDRSNSVSENAREPGAGQAQAPAIHNEEVKQEAAPPLPQTPAPQATGSSRNNSNSVSDGIEQIGAQAIPLRDAASTALTADHEIGGLDPFPHAMQIDLAPSRMRARVRGFSMSANPSATIDPRSNPLFVNMAAALFWNLNEEHALGIEGGQEAIPQLYSGVENSLPVRYEQNLLTPWFGAIYRYRPSWARIGSKLTPLAELHAGATREFWPEGRLALGIGYAPLPKLSLELAVEGSILAYPFQSTWFTTRKLGVTYGLVVSF